MLLAIAGLLSANISNLTHLEMFVKIGYVSTIPKGDGLEQGLAHSTSYYGCLFCHRGRHIDRHCM